MTAAHHQNGKQAQRQAAMAVLAHSDAAEIARRLAAIALPAHENLREPENGLVMVRGRTGGDGAAFNLGEATVSRAAVRLATGEVGFGYTLGRDRLKAQMIALPELPTVEKVAQSLNTLGVTPRDMMAIFQAMKQAGALQAELIIR